MNSTQIQNDKFDFKLEPVQMMNTNMGEDNKLSKKGKEEKKNHCQRKS